MRNPEHIDYPGPKKEEGNGSDGVLMLFLPQSVSSTLDPKTVPFILKTWKAVNAVRKHEQRPCWMAAHIFILIF